MDRPRGRFLHRVGWLSGLGLLCFMLVGMANAWAAVPQCVASGTDEPRTALVIGNAAYTGLVRVLNSPVNDAEDFAALLNKMGFLVFTGSNLSKQDFESLVEQFTACLQRLGGVGLFYFSGHGAQVEGKNYLIPVSLTQPGKTNVKYQAVPAEWVLEKMSEGREGLNLIFLDACRNEPSGKALGSSPGLAFMNAPSGTLIAYATAPQTVAADGLERNSLYTAKLLDAIQQNPNQEIKTLLQAVRGEVKKGSLPLVAAGKLLRAQEPWESTSMYGDFRFGKDINVAPRPRAPLQAGQVFRDRLRDGSEGPALVVIGAGEFWMGSPESEAGREPAENAGKERRHRVRIERAFALGQNEVTVGEFRRFVDASGYRTDAEKNGEGCYVWKDSKWQLSAGLSWRNPGFKQGDDHPVACVSWNDANRYVDWLSQQTRQNYRLPSEAEWEYAARAGTTTARYWGEDPDQACGYANVADQTLGWTPMHECRDGYTYTAPVGSFKANAWKLYDMLGNVWEWTCSAYAKDYDSSEAKCAEKGTTGPLAVRGGSWLNLPAGVRSAARSWNTPAFRNYYLGFRLARSL